MVATDEAICTGNSINLAALPASVDWRDKGVVTAVKNQGPCGSCWAFSASATLESHIAINTGKLFNFSEQQMVDCTDNPNECGGTGGCSGATQDLAFAHIASTGITTSEAWPYKASQSQCSWGGGSKKPIAIINGYQDLPVNDYAALMNAVATRGPIAVSVAASQWATYGSGVFTGCKGASGSDVNHAVTLVGYGTGGCRLVHVRALSYARVWCTAFA
jgi:cathepsin L